MTIFFPGLFSHRNASGGGSAAGFINPGDGTVEVNTFANLPSAAANSGNLAWVKTTTGTVFVDRKISGWYRSTGSAWVPAEIATDEDSEIATDPTGRTNAAGTTVETALDQLDAAITLKAPLASPALTGSPTAPTQSVADNSTKIATTAYVDRDANTGTVTISASAIDWSLGTSFYKSIGSTATTFTFSNTVDGKTIVVAVASTTGSITLPSVIWSGGVAPSKTNSKTIIYTFVKINGSVYGSAVDNMS